MIVLIDKICLDKNGILCVKPRNHSFGMIYRSAMGVYWNEKDNCLFHNPPVEWNTMQWYRQIIAAVKNEYGADLEICSNTIFENLDGQVKSQIATHLDGAKIIALSEKGDYGEIAFFDNSLPAIPVCYLAICQYEKKSKVYLFSCDENLKVQGDTLLDSFEDARSLAQNRSKHPIVWSIE